jgi:hypothetical protein
MHFIRVIRNLRWGGLTVAIYRIAGIEFGLSGTRGRVIGNHIRVIRNPTLGYQEPRYRVNRNPLIGLIGTLQPPKSLNPRPNHPDLPAVTRARDLNYTTNYLTHTLPKSPGSKGGSAPLAPLNPPNPPYPRKERPTGNQNHSRQYRGAALWTAGK